MYNLNYWRDLYEQFKFDSCCIDIETTYFDGPISVISIYRPKDGIIECQTLVRGDDLTSKNLAHALEGCRMLITFNGFKFDVPKIKQEFPGVIPDDLPVLDLYLFSKALFGLNVSLKTLENTFYILRPSNSSERKGIAIGLWKKYLRENDRSALNQLIEYNQQDAINLYPLAEKLISKAKQDF